MMMMMTMIMIMMMMMMALVLLSDADGELGARDSSHKSWGGASLCDLEKRHRCAHAGIFELSAYHPKHLHDAPP